MATGTPFAPTPFASSVVAPATSSMFRSAPYLSIADYRLAPTAVGTNALVAGTNSQASSDEALAKVIDRASSWIDEFCFHRPDGTLVACPTTESRFVRLKPNGSLPLICNYKPVIEVIGIAGGAAPSQLANLDSTTAQAVWVTGKTIWVPGGFSFSTTPALPAFGPFASYNGGVFAVWTYVAGYPHAVLGASCSANATSLTLAPAVAGATTIYGVYAGTPLTILDGINTETVIAAAAPNGLTVSLIAGTAYAHTKPTAPDTILVSAMPPVVQQAAISLTSVLLKTRGMRAQVLPSLGGHGAAGKADSQAMAMAGALDDYNLACKLLKPLRVVFQQT